MKTSTVKLAAYSYSRYFTPPPLVAVWGINQSEIQSAGHSNACNTLLNMYAPYTKIELVSLLHSNQIRGCRRGRNNTLCQYIQSLSSMDKPKKKPVQRSLHLVSLCWSNRLMLFFSWANGDGHVPYDVKSYQEVPSTGLTGMDMSCTM